nr:MAG TPA: hypothetical protein [Caudoviricetes sp.]
MFIACQDIQKNVRKKPLLAATRNGFPHRFSLTRQARKI